MSKKLLQSLGTALLLSYFVIDYVLNVVEFRFLAVIFMIIFAVGAIGMWKIVIDTLRNRN